MFSIAKAAQGIGKRLPKKGKMFPAPPRRMSPVGRAQSDFVRATQIVEFIAYKELDLARLVEEILVAQGYRTQASPFGNDGSVYILADGGIGPLGFALPRVAALVRPIDQMVDPDVAELEAFKTLSGSENGLFASWLYFSDETKEEAGRLFMPNALSDRAREKKRGKKRRCLYKYT